MSGSGFQFDGQLKDADKLVATLRDAAVFEDADENFREARQKLRAEADKYLDLVEQSLQGKQHTEHLFTIRWRITA